MVRRAEQHRLLGQRDALPLVLQDPLDDELGLLRLVVAGDQLRRGPSARSDQNCFSNPCGASAMTRLVASRIGCVLR